MDDERKNNRSRDEQEELEKRAGMARWAAKSGVEQTLQAGLQGAPQLGREEKSRHLGEFRERVLRLLTRKQVAQPILYREILEALADPRAKRIIIHGDIPGRFTDKYEAAARSRGIPVTFRRDSEFKGDAGLIVAAADAVEATAIEVEERAEKLLRLGLPDRLIQAAGRKICKECRDLVALAAPEELPHYPLLRPIDRLFGEKCPAHGGS